jgi:hypothetical protein
MARINLETEPRFKEMLKQLGFKKSRGVFGRNEKESIMKLRFGHGTYGQKFVRYYDCLYVIDYPKINEVAAELGELVFGQGGQIGYLTPEYRFREWRLADSDSDEYYLHMINDIKETMTQYVIPYMEKYSTIEAFVKGVESGNISPNFFDNKAVAIAYVLLGRKDDALHYLDQCIEEQKKLDFYGKGTVVIKTKGKTEIVSYPDENRNLKELQVLRQKLKDRKC